SEIIRFSQTTLKVIKESTLLLLEMEFLEESLSDLLELVERNSIKTCFCPVQTLSSWLHLSMMLVKLLMPEITIGEPQILQLLVQRFIITITQQLQLLVQSLSINHTW